MENIKKKIKGGSDLPEYTKSEKCMVAFAVTEPLIYLERADTLLDDLISTWFETLEPSEELLNNYKSISNMLFTISDALAQALFDLDAFCTEDGGRARYLIERAESLKAIINAERGG